MNNNRGQIIVEAVLLILVTTGVILMVTKGLQNMNFVQSMTSGPWVRLQGMIECGVWSPCGVSQPAAGMHPSTTSRVLSYDNSDD